MNEKSTKVTSSAPPEKEKSLIELFHILWFHRYIFLMSFILIVVLGVITFLSLEKKYTANSVLMIGEQKSNVLDIKTVLSGQDTDRNRTISGEIEVLQSRELAKKVIEKLNLLSLPEFNIQIKVSDSTSFFEIGRFLPDGWKTAKEKDLTDELSDEELDKRAMISATNIFLRGLKVQTVKVSNVVKISYTASDPKVAAMIANELAESYIIGQMEARFKATERATKWLNEQLTDLKSQVEISEKAVQDYREKYGITEIKKGDGVVNEQLLAINNQLILARSNRVQAAARLRQIKKLMEGNGAGVESATDVLDSSLIQSLREEESKIKRKASELSIEYGPKHPVMLQINAEIIDIQNQIKNEIQKIASGISNEVEVASINERSLEKSLEELKKASGAQSKESVQLRALEREADANRTLLDTFLMKFKETSSTIGMESSNARVISKAEIPVRPSFPNKPKAILLILGGAFVFAICVVFLIEAMTPGILSPEQVDHELGISTIGIIPHIADHEPQSYVLEKPHSIYGESLNSLKTSLLLSSPDEIVKVIQITSSVPEEGKSTVALSFARLLAMSGKKVMLIDADLRRASLELKLGISVNRKGLTDLVIGENNELQDVIVKDERSDLILMPKGVAEYVNATDIFSSRRMKAIIASLKKQFDYVIFDTPPVLAVPDARIIGQLVDKTVFVVKWDKTPVKVAKAALGQLNMDDVDVAGCVLQQVNLKKYSRYGYGNSGYYYHYSRYGSYYTS